VKLGLTSATLSQESSRRGGIARALLRDAYGKLDRVGAVSGDDADRLIALGVPASRITVTGDTRYDQVWERAKRADHASSLLGPLASERPTLVAGSTWPADEAVLLDAWKRLRDSTVDARLIIAPHEPLPAHLEPIEAWARASGLVIARLGTEATAMADIILVDRVGVLGDLYALADVAYVGGAFHAAGLHSVLEPAAFGVPVIVGPRYRGNRDARVLIDGDAAVCVTDADETFSALTRWLSDGVAERNAAGEAAARIVFRGMGAAERSYALVASLITSR
jgi:3-deoxy-D-manno-octulosonic-acid transferase